MSETVHLGHEFPYQIIQVHVLVLIIIHIMLSYSHSPSLLLAPSASLQKRERDIGLPKPIKLVFMSVKTIQKDRFTPWPRNDYWTQQRRI